MGPSAGLAEVLAAGASGGFAVAAAGPLVAAGDTVVGSDTGSDDGASPGRSTPWAAAARDPARKGSDKNPAAAIIRARARRREVTAAIKRRPRVSPPSPR